MGKIANFYKKHAYELAVFAVMLVAVFFRFYDYDHRWVLAGDQARDAIVAHEALKNITIPALGPFSSAGNYTTGNTWYVWLIASTALFPYSIMTPWIILSASYVFLVYLMIRIGKELSGNLLGIILGLFTAVSPAQVLQSFNLTNPSLIAIFTAGSLLFMIKYIKTGRSLQLFLFAFLLSCAISIHLQAVYLLLLIPLALLFKRPSVRGVLLLMLGILLPFISYAIFDMTHGYYNYRGIVDYLQYGQYKIYVPNRWLLYAGVFWPNLWGNIIGGSSLLGYILIGLVVITNTYALIKRKVSKPLFIILIWFFVVFIALRFYKGEKFEGYFIFLHIFVLILTSWACYLILRANRYAGFFVILIVLMGSCFMNIGQIRSSSNYTSLQASHWSNLLMNTYPKEKFAIYNLKNASPGKSIPLVLYLDQEGRNSQNGHKIGIGSMDNSERKYHKMIKGNKMGFELWDLNTSSSAQLRMVGMERIAPRDIYKSVTEWYK